jgi:hypothetical protein
LTKSLLRLGKANAFASLVECQLVLRVPLEEVCLVSCVRICHVRDIQIPMLVTFEYDLPIIEWNELMEVGGVSVGM